MNSEDNKQNYLETPKMLQVFLNPLQKGNQNQNNQVEILSAQNRNITNATSEQRILKILPNPKKIPTFFQETSPYRLIIGDTPLRSPYKDFRLKDLIETPPKNDLIFDSFRLDTSTEKYDYSNNKSCYEIGLGPSIKGKKINFANESENYFNNESEDEHTKINNNNNNGHCINVVNNNFILNNQTNKKICCTCVKTECIKKYCACYAKGQFCEGCECKNCLNTLEAFQKSHSNININIIKNNNSNKDNIGSSNLYNSLCEENKLDNNEYNPLGYNNSNNNMSTIIINNNINPFNQNHLHTEVICNCTKSNCTKKYCECFKMGRRCDALCRCVNCFNKASNSTENNNNNGKQLQTIENFGDNNYLKNNHLVELSKQNEDIYNKNKKIDFQAEQFLTNSQQTINHNVINHLNKNIQNDNIRNKARKLCLSFKSDCIGIEINRKGIKIDKRNLLFEEPEQKDKQKGKVKDKNNNVVQHNINCNNINKDIKKKSSNITPKVKNENIGNNEKMIEEIQTTPKMTKRKRSRNKNESTNMKTPSTSTGKQRTNKRKLNLRDHRITKKKLIL